MKRKHIIISLVVGIIAGLIYYVCTATPKPELTTTPAPTMQVTEPAESLNIEQTQPPGNYAPEATGIITETVSEDEASNNTPAPTSEYWELVIDGKTINVGDSVDEASLDKRPGWMDTSALPGEGTTVILGHRNNSHLRVLENAEIGDVISLNVGETSHSYTISEINIHEDSNYTIPATEGNALVLVTCYPFRYSGNAPDKAVFICT